MWSQGEDSNLRYTVLQFAAIRPNPSQRLPSCHVLYSKSGAFVPTGHVAYHRVTCSSAAKWRQLLGRQ